MKVSDPPQQRLAAMQDDREIDKAVPSGMLLDSPQQLLQKLVAHQLRLVIDGSVAEPVAIGAIDVAARGNLDQQLPDRLACEVDRLLVVSRHTDTATR